MKLLYREEKPTTGKVFVDGVDLSKIKNRHVPYFRRKIGVVFQEYRLLPKKTVYENVAFALEIYGLPSDEIRKKVQIFSSISESSKYKLTLPTCIFQTFK